MTDAGLFLGASLINKMHDTESTAESNTSNMDIMKKLDTLIASMNTNNNELNTKVDGINVKLSELSDNLSKIDNRVTTNEEKIVELEKSVSKNSVRITNVEKDTKDHNDVLKDVQESCKFLSNEYELLKDLPSEFAALKRENVSLKKLNDDLTVRLQNEEISGNKGRQYQRDTHNVKLVGVPRRIRGEIIYCVQSCHSGSGQKGLCCCFN